MDLFRRADAVRRRLGHPHEGDPAADVRRRNKRAENELRDQFDQQDGANQITGGASELGQRAQDLADFHAALNRSDKEVEVEATTLFVTSADDPQLAMRRAQALRDSFKQYEFHLEAPLGGQEELWWAAWPGVPARSKVWEFAQITTGREFSTGVPIVGFRLGDATGARMGTNISCGRRAPVLVDRVATLEANLSACFAAVAELGAGKSVLMKADMGAMLDRGGRVLAIDRTERREYAEFAAAMRPDKKQIVDLLGPTISLDPLRIFKPARAARMVNPSSRRCWVYRCATLEERSSPRSCSRPTSRNTGSRACETWTSISRP